MSIAELKEQIAHLEERMASLPTGSIVKKKVNGKEYYYHRWSESGKRQEKYVSVGDVPALRTQIKQRKILEKQLRDLQKQLPKLPSVASREWAATIHIGEELRSFSAGVRQYRKRECFQQLHDYIYGPAQDKVLILYGLRRTGKTTLIRQLFAEMSNDDLSKTAFIQVGPKNTLAEINHDLRRLEEQGFRYVLLDEVTRIEDFIEGAALFSDIFAACGMKIVLSGTDSLGFLFAKDEQLYDRCILLHTTFIPYREFESVLGIRGIDAYIRYGGTMSLGGVHYSETSTFATKERADEYVDTAIARNIQHSLRCYQHEGHFRHLQDLYEAGELTSAINRVVADINHRFTLEVLTQDFRSSDLSISASNLRRNRTNPTDILDRVDVSAVTENLRTLLEIRNKEEQTVPLDDIHAAEIKEYLDLLDLTQDIEILHLPHVGEKGFRTAIAQPGLRYAQASALIQSLLLDETFIALSLPERNAVQERILSEIMGRMMEDIVLLETKLASPGKQVFVLRFPVGKFDMVVFDPAAANCEIFEIKHSAEVVPAQYRHLADPQKCAETEHRFGPIMAKTVLYRGDPQTIDGIRYENVETYLCGLGKIPKFNRY